MFPKGEGFGFHLYAKKSKKRKKKRERTLDFCRTVEQYVSQCQAMREVCMYDAFSCSYDATRNAREKVLVQILSTVQAHIGQQPKVERR